MRGVYKYQPKGFTAGLDYIRQLDEASLKTPLYARRFAAAYKEAIKDFSIAYAARFSGADTSRIFAQDIYPSSVG